MSRNIRLTKMVRYPSLLGTPGPEVRPTPVELPIPDDLPDEEIIKRVRSVVGPIKNIAFEVFEPTGDVRVFFDNEWHYSTAVSERAIEAMLSEL